MNSSHLCKGGPRSKGRFGRLDLIRINCKRVMKLLILCFFVIFSLFSLLPLILYFFTIKFLKQAHIYAMLSSILSEVNLAYRSHRRPLPLTLIRRLLNAGTAFLSTRKPLYMELDCSQTPGLGDPSRAALSAPYEWGFNRGRGDRSNSDTPVGMEIFLRSPNNDSSGGWNSACFQGYNGAGEGARDEA